MRFKNMLPILIALVLLALLPVTALAAEQPVAVSSVGDLSWYVEDDCLA